MRRFFCGFALAAAVAGALVPSSSRACSCVGGVRASSPSDGAADVPTNAEVKLLVYFGDATFTLEQNGQPVSTTVVEGRSGDARYIRLRPVEPLAPRTAYRVMSDFAEPTPSFVTGDGPDTTAPTFGGFEVKKSVSEGGNPLFGGISSCGPTEGYILGVSEGQDDRSPSSDVWFHVYAGRSSDEIDFSNPVTAVSAGEVFLGESGCNHNLDVEQSAVVALAAVDVAGNESPHAKPEALGCGCGAGSGPSAAFLALALFGLARVQRRRAAAE